MMQGRDDTDGVPVGNGRHISPAEFLLMAGFLAYRAPLASPDARAAARRVLVAVLEVATARGFADSDLLQAMMANAEKSSLVLKLAEQATAAVGNSAAYLHVIRSAGVIMESDS
jgi:hypothetical protein